MNYKKSILSLVTIMALSATASADGVATYLPLTTDDHDASWTLFGVNGFSSGVASKRATTTAGFSAGYISVNDAAPTDALAVSGLLSGGGDLLSVQGIDDDSLTDVKVAAKILQPYEATEPVRSMYIKVNSSKPNIKIDYKASMEGQTLEIMINNSTTLYSVTIDEDYTYANAATATLAVAAAETGDKLSNIEDVLDYNFRDNPLDARYFVKSTNLTTASDMVAAGNSAKNATFYHYDSVSQQWKIWNKKFSGSANDFSAFSKGDAYWGQIDTDDLDPTNDAAEANVTKSGLILGSSGVATPDATVYANKLQNGWNMVAIDPSKPFIRHASTGMIAKMDDTNGSIKVTDSTGQYDVSIKFATGSTNAVKATLINKTIESAKLLGTIPPSVNIKAFSTSSTEILFISDAKFTLTDVDDNKSITTVTTLTGDEPYNAIGTRDAITDLNESSATDAFKSATSAYGEYGFIIELLTEDLATNGSSTRVKTASRLDFDAKANGGTGGDTFSAMIRLGTADRNYEAIALTATNDANASATDAKDEIEKHALFADTVAPTTAYGRAWPIDTDANGYNDKMLLASTVPFYIKDNTFTRVFTETNSSGDGSRSINVVGTGDVKAITPATGGSNLAAAKLISAQADGTNGTGVYADFNGSKLIAVSTTLSTFDIKDFEDGENSFLTASSDSSTLAKGAVAGVYSLDTVAQLAVVQHIVTHSDFVISTNTTEENNITIRINGDTTMEGNISNFRVDIQDDDNVTSYFDTIVSTINTILQNAGIHGFAYHTYESGNNNANSLLTTKVVINGMDINATSSDINVTTVAAVVAHNPQLSIGAGTTNDVATTASGSTAATPAAETLGLSWSALVGDLKTNPIYTPDFAVRGPLYTFKDAGYDVRSILKATTEFTNGTIAWDGIDLTRDESDWFKNNEFNLFNVNNESGYWVYLENITANSIEIANATYTPTYTYYFDNKDTAGDYKTRNIINGGQFSVEIKNLDGEVTTAYLTVSGEEVPLKRNGTTDNYTADFMKYSLSSFSEGSSGPMSFSVRATNGKGTYKNMSEVMTFDYTAPTIIAPVVPTNKYNELTFSVDTPTASSDVAKFYVFNEYIPELKESRASATATINRLVGSYDAANGISTTNVCKELTFGLTNNLRVVAVDGTGLIGSANVSDAMQFKYAVMLKGAHVLTHVAGTDDKSIVGVRYDSSCENRDTNTTLTADDNSGISLKTLVDNQTSRLAYEEIAGVSSSLSGAWVSTYSIEGVDVIQVQNLEEYADKPFFVEYGGKMYRSAFPHSKSDAEDSADTAIKLDDSTAFVLDTDTNERDTTGGTGEVIDILNSTLAN